MFIIPLFQVENFPYSIIPEKKEQIIPLRTSAYSIIPRHRMALFHSYKKKNPLFLHHYSSSPPKVEPAMLSLVESESTVIFFGTLLQVGDPNGDSVSEPALTGPDHELMVDATSPPEQIKEQAENFIKYINGEGVTPEESVVSIELWDFAGQHLYYASHPVFLSSRALYILVCNLSKSLHDTAKPCVRQGSCNVELENPNGETNLENLLSWLSTVHSVAQMRRETCDDVEKEVPHLRPPVIIVGTHADKPFEDIATMKTEIQNAIAGKDYEGHVVRPIFSIDNTAKLTQRKIQKKVFGKDENIDDIRALQVKIMEALRQEPYIGERIPVR